MMAPTRRAGGHCPDSSPATVISSPTHRSAAAAGFLRASAKAASAKAASAEAAKAALAALAALAGASTNAATLMELAQILRASCPVCLQEGKQRRCFCPLRLLFRR